MAAANNDRVYYAIEQVQIADPGNASNIWRTVYGLQDAGSRTSFNLNQVFELGQSEVYENIEDIPDVEVTLSKVLDGTELIWHKATGGSATSPSLKARANIRSALRMGIWDDSNDSATGAPVTIVETSGMYPSSLAYAFSVGDEFTESVTFVGNDRIWSGDPRIVNTEALARSNSLSMDGSFTSNNHVPPGSGGINRRENLMFEYVGGTGTTTDVNGMVADSDCTILPTEIFGISASGTNEQSNGENYDVHVQGIDISVDFGREPIFELGRNSPYVRLAQANIPVSCNVEILATSGDMISATEEGILSNAGGCAGGTNLSNATIRVATCEGTRIYLGANNKLDDVSFGGGDTGGGNATVTYSFIGFNTCTVIHSNESGDAAVAGTWWDSRDTYLLSLT